MCHLRKSSAAGFTIIETMVVLAISGMLLASAMLLINGRQAKSEFLTGTRSFVSSINSLALNVSTGYSATGINYTCQLDAPGTVGAGGAPGTPPQLHVTTTGAQSQGSNTGCIFIGQAIQLPTPGNSAAYTVTPLIGEMYRAGNNAAGVFSQNVIDSGVAPITGASQMSSVENGVTIGCVLYSDAVSPPTLGNQPCTSGPSGGSYHLTNAVTFLTTSYGLTVLQGDDATGTSSSQVNAVVPRLATNPNAALDPSTYTGTVGGAANDDINPPGGIYICLQSGSTNNHTIATLGGKTSQFSASTTTYSGGCS